MKTIKILFLLFTVCSIKSVTAQSFQQAKQLVSSKLSKSDNNVCCNPYKTFSVYELSITDDMEDENYLYLEGVAEMKCFPNTYSRYGKGVPADEMIFKKVGWRATIRKKGNDSYLKKLLVIKNGTTITIYPKMEF